MNIGDIVKHKNMPDRLRIRTMSGDVCTLEFIDRPKIDYQFTVDYERCISNLDNLSPYEEEKKPQLNLFE
jgi:hypothetical protein